MRTPLIGHLLALALSGCLDNPWHQHRQRKGAQLQHLEHATARSLAQQNRCLSIKLLKVCGYAQAAYFRQLLCAAEVPPEQVETWATSRHDCAEPAPYHAHRAHSSVQSSSYEASSGQLTHAAAALAQVSGGFQDLAHAGGAVEAVHHSPDCNGCIPGQ